MCYRCLSEGDPRPDKRARADPENETQELALQVAIDAGRGVQCYDAMDYTVIEPTLVTQNHAKHFLRNCEKVSLRNYRIISN